MGVGAGKDSLFFAIRPDADAAARIKAQCNRLRAAHGLSGKPISTDRLHITLHFLGEFDETIQEVADKAGDVARFAHAAPFDITLDRALSFNTTKARRPLVLGATPSLELKSFQKDLGTSLMQAGLPNMLRGFTPHLTLLYDEHPVEEQAVSPIRWEVHEFVLVRSLVGRSRHETLGRWPLRGI